MRKFILENKPGERIAVAVLNSAPGDGILVLMDRQELVGPFLKTKEGEKLSIIQLEQPPELCGIEEPKGWTEEERWNSTHNQGFCTSLNKAVRSSKISTLRISLGTNSSRWDKYYAPHVPIPVKNVPSDIVETD